jgi:hypothetical protein
MTAASVDRQTPHAVEARLRAVTADIADLERTRQWINIAVWGIALGVMIFRRPTDQALRRPQPPFSVACFVGYESSLADSEEARQGAAAGGRRWRRWCSWGCSTPSRRGR